ncbi:uncharacterized protein LOC143445052 isoform X4 [Clavelina lepadiformis]|uniref:uncharacterized protein LOC143445052 isoform X4 n=1 Tax=Clavelina lepadiformis TaxID=159417 RepID=UPI0040419974
MLFSSCILLLLAGIANAQEDPSCPDDYVSYTDGSKCYKLVEISASYDDATAACGRDGARMAMPKSQAAVKFLIDYIKANVENTAALNGQIQLGGKLVGDKYVWQDGKALEDGHWVGWKRSQPDLQKECFAMVLTGSWRTKACRRKAPYFCQLSLNGCADDPCLNGGSCSSLGGNDISCKCPEGISGERCQDVSACTLRNKCKNGAKCVEDDDEDDGTKCNCLPGFFGKTCARASKYKCSARGDPHYKTFDGSKIDFMGTCNYILLNITCPTYPSSSLHYIRVEVENTGRGNRKISWFLRGIVYVQGLKINIGRGGIFKVNGAAINLPYEHEKTGLKIFSVGTSYRIITSFMAEIKYNGLYNLDVFLPIGYKHCTEGLCGSFNDNSDDDLEGLTEDEFGNKWKTEGGQPRCRDGVLLDDCPKKTYDTGECDCDIINAKDGCFSACHGKIDPENFMSDCTYDMCHYKGEQQALVTNIAAYATQCQAAGISICKWRERCGFVPVCPPNSRYTQCVSECESSCMNPRAKENCPNTAPCQEGCECNDGFYKSSDECVPLQDCGCLVDKKYIKTGSAFYKDGCTEICECVNREVHCETTSCDDYSECKLDANGVLGCYPAEYSTCKVWGDSHYISFDGSTDNQYEFGGTCRYCFTKTVGMEPNDPYWFKVIIDHVVQEAIEDFPRLVMRSATIEIGGTDISVVNFLFDGTVKINQETVTSFSNGYMSLNQQSNFLTLSLKKNGIKIQFSRGKLLVHLPSSYKKKLDCLCGNYNGDLYDDITNDQGLVTDNVTEFGQKFQEGICVNPLSPPSNDCVNDVYQYEGTECGAIKSPEGPFLDCHNHVDPEPYFKNCVFDTCGRNEDTAIADNALNEYASECHKKDDSLVDCDWMNKSNFTIVCPDNQHYDGCGTACPNTCQDPFASDSCPQPRVSGCVCKSNLLRDGDACIKQEDCGCTLPNGFYVSQGFSKITHHCQQECKCVSPNNYVCKDDPCKDGLVCEENEIGLSYCVPGPDYTTPAPDSLTTIPVTCKEDMVVDLVIVVDTSSSIGSKNFKFITNFIAKVISNFPVNPRAVQVGALSYSRTPKVLWKLGDLNDLSQVVNALDAISYPGGGTNTGLALAMVSQELMGRTSSNGRRAGVPGITVLITDGPSLDDPFESAAFLREISSVVVVGIGETITETELRGIASSPSDKFVNMVEDFDDLDEIALSLAESLCYAKAVNKKDDGAMKGDFHYKTLDGRSFSFLGTCTYVMLDVTCSALDKIKVTLINDPVGHAVPYWFAKAVVDILYLQIEIRRDGVVVIDKTLVNLPYATRDGEIRVRSAGLSVKIVSKNGIMIEYDGSYNFRVALPTTYNDCVEGLAGNYNGDPSDDFGSLSKFEHAEAWKVKGSPISCIPSGQLPGCDAKGFKVGQCGCDIMSDPNSPFSECMRIIDPLLYIEDCEFDACMHNGSSFAIEGNIASYVKDCETEGVVMDKMYKWKEWCDIEDRRCPANSTFDSCSNGCPNTCVDPEAETKCPSEPCVAGCRCDEGLLLSAQECVKPEECGCLFKGQYYKANQKFYVPDCSELCACVDGNILCEEGGCNDDEICSIRDGVLDCEDIEISSCGTTDQGTYSNFDGDSRIIFTEDCMYTLSKVNVYKMNERWFEVRAQTILDQTGTITFKSVRVLLKAEAIYIDLGPGLSIYVNNELKSEYNSSEVNVSKLGQSVVLKTSFDLKVVFDGSQVVVNVSSRYAGQLGGVCGNFNNILSDDFVIDGKPTDDIENFMISNQVGKCGSIPLPPINDCPNDLFQSEFGSFCGAISDEHGPFSECHSHADPSEFYSGCLTSACSNVAQFSIVEESLTSYAEECENVGQKVCSWREDTGLKVECPENSRYVQCAVACANTCWNRNAENSCEEEPIDRCVCNSGYFLNENEQCVFEDQCGCNLPNNNYIPLGYRRFNYLCNEECECKKTNDYSCISTNCNSNEVCMPVGEGRYDCIELTNNTLPTFIPTTVPSNDSQGKCPIGMRIDVIFVVESSFSMTPKDFSQVILFLKKMIEGFDIGSNAVQVGLVVYGVNVVGVFKLNQHHTSADLLEAISEITQFQTGAKTGQALDYVISNMLDTDVGRRLDVPAAVVVLMDGASRDDPVGAASTLQQYATVVTIGIKNAKQSLLNVMASPSETNANVMEVSSFFDLSQLVTTAVEHLCSMAVREDVCISEKSCSCKLPNGATVYKGFTYLKDDCTQICICAGPRGFICTATSCKEEEICEFNELLDIQHCFPQENYKCNPKTVLDIVFLLDSSLAVRRQNFKQFLHFTSDVVRRFEIGPEAVQVALVRFSDTADIVFSLSAHSDENGLLEAIDYISNEPGERRMGQAFAEVTEKVLSANGGKRPGVPAVVLVLATGHSYDTITPAVDNLRNKSQIVALGIKEAEYVILEQMASPPIDEMAIYASDFLSLHNKGGHIASLVCNLGVISDECKLENGYVIKEGYKTFKENCSIDCTCEGMNSFACVENEVDCASCDLTAGAHYICKIGTTPPPQVDIDECTTGTHDCSKNAECTNTIESYDCSCFDGFRGNGRFCEDIDECYEASAVCDDNADCINTPGSYNCTCQRGYYGTGVLCQDQNECSLDPFICNDGQCSNTLGSYICRCWKGYIGDGYNCTDIDECAEDKHDCDENAVCINEQPGFTCSCEEGFSGDGKSCDDINECDSDYQCDQNAECINTVGSYTCQCVVGYSGDGILCISSDVLGKCDSDSSWTRWFNEDDPSGEGDEETVSKIKYRFPDELCDYPTAIQALTVDGVPYAQSGKVLILNVTNGLICVNNYQTNGCVDFKVRFCCSGTVGTCPTSHAWTQWINSNNSEASGDLELLTELRKKLPGLCYSPPAIRARDSENKIVFTLANNFLAVHPSYGLICSHIKQKYGNCADYEVQFCCPDPPFNDDIPDVNECEQQTDNCGENSICVNTEGSFYCECKEGYIGDGVDCEEFDECSNNIYLCARNAICTNTDGGFTCECVHGYFGDGYTLCELEVGPTAVSTTTSYAEHCNKTCHQHADCKVVYYKDICICKPGFTGLGELNCADINECMYGTDDCTEYEDCVNSLGSFTCYCKPGYVRNEAGYCEVTDICKDKCHKNADCFAKGYKVNCVCKSGFTGPGALNCADINECMYGTHGCSAKEQCVNTLGSFYCKCRNGFVKNSDGKCTDQDECNMFMCGDNAECVNNDGSYKCYCNDGYSKVSSNLCEDVNECKLFPNVCGKNFLCTNSNGSYLCTCKSGFILHDNGTCQDFNECEEEIDECYENKICVNTPGSYKCNCEEGYQLDAYGTCNDIDECWYKAHDCSANTRCVNTVPGYNCVCVTGFEFNDANICEDINECNGLNKCSTNATCTDTVGSYNCECNEGYSGNGKICTDINECTSNIHDCDSNAECENFYGGFSCACMEGFTGDGINFCDDINECEDETTCSVNATCQNNPGSFACSCKLGYTGQDGVYCHDIDECSNPVPVCPVNSICVNKENGYDCSCKTGYTGDGDSYCIDINECEQNSSICSELSTCVNTKGSYNCHCKDGFQKNSRGQCEDVNECENGKQKCNKNSKCQNLVPGYECTCLDGFTGKGADIGCSDINECLLDLDNCANTAECINLIGGFKCVCPSGYFGDPTENCTGIDECENENICGSSSVCLNTDESYLCVCMTGYIGTPTDKCTDVDECSENAHGCSLDEECKNSPGSYTCQCIEGLRRNPITLQCDDIDECTEGLHNCAGNSICRNTKGSFTCHCMDGFAKQSGDYCQDINECDNATYVCQDNAACENVPGSFACNCFYGYQVNSTGECEDLDECAEATHDCSVNADCVNVDGGYDCECQDGFELNSYDECKDINECEDGTAYCIMNAYCNNTYGSYQCNCDEGYSGSGKNYCQNINECSAGIHNCVPNSRCIDTDGSFKCTACLPGFMGSPTSSCDDVDECELGLASCHDNASCINTVGSYKCKCNSGFSGEGFECSDIDECKDGASSCATYAECKNTPGSYDCFCHVGFTGNGLEECNDIDECSGDENLCGRNANCINQKGSFTCQCKEGYTGQPYEECITAVNDAVTTAPPDVDECASEKSCSINSNCQNTIGSYLCNCNDGYTGDGINGCFDVNECKGDNSCSFPKKCVNNHGGYDCVCINGYQLVEDVCQDINECAYDSTDCVSRAKCINAVGSYICECRPGYAGVGTEECTDIDECETGTHTCQANSYCNNTIGKFTCTCDSGYSGDPKSGCTDIDECASETSECGKSSECSNTAGSYTCICEEGFAKTLTDVCENINECNTNIHSCGENAICRDTFGSFTCKCKPGYTGNPKEICDDLDECASNTTNCVQNALCRNTDGSYECQCKEGFNGFGTYICEDIDECKRPGACPEFMKCSNTVGSYRCQCIDGYKTETNNSCSDIDECSEGTSICVSDSTCNNIPGSHECTCNTGYRGEGKVLCEDVDECAENSSNCSQEINTECVNVRGGFLCVCKTGYEESGDGNCTDIKECSAGNVHCDTDATCENTDGSYQCVCNEGFQDDQYGGCDDVNECEDSAVCIETAKCLNIVGSFSCQCADGFFGNPNEECWDKNECLLNEAQCGSNEKCENRIGSFECLCLTGFEEDSKSGECVDVDECDREEVRCRPNSECVNIPGSYICKCLDGFAEINDQCKDINECATSAQRCAPNAKCANTVGSFQCTCKPGFIGDGASSCEDYNECKLDDFKCYANSNCVNTFGSYKCACVSGYVNTGSGSCRDIDECVLSPSACLVGSSCINTPGSFHCGCNDGYTGYAANSCVDIDECVVLSNACDNNAECTNKLGSYTCTCNLGFISSGAGGNSCEDINECRLSNIVCGTNARCNNSPGSYQCFCNAGYEGDPTDVCQDIDECLLGLTNCLEGAECINNRGSFSCACADGYQGNGVTECINVDECLSRPCDPDAVCKDTDGSFECTCNQGLRGDGLASCQDIDECKLYNELCGPNSECTNTFGSYVCACDAGYQRIDGICEDLDECRTGEPCADNATCTNTPGSYNCQCDEGYVGLGEVECSNVNECANSSLCAENAICTDNDGSYRCECIEGYAGDGEVFCSDVDNCVNGEHNCLLDALCVNKPGTFGCKCGLGYSGDGIISCTEINECEDLDLNKCDSTAECNNTDGSYTCTCASGYQGDGFTCKDIDECLENLHECADEATCTNVAGTYVCNCILGYEGNPYEECYDVDECFGAEPPCNNLATCENIDGGLNCTCQKGYSGDGISQCDDIDECLTHTCEETATCQNTAGSFKCQCIEGYEFDGSSCVDVDECDVAAHHCSEYEVCTNVEGGYDCNCKNGYQLNSYDECEDNNECLAENQCSLNATCKNSPGSYMCKCNPGYRGNGNKCEDIDECAEGTHNCGPSAVCLNALGSFNCICKSGYEMQDREICVDIDECFTGDNKCVSNASCTNTIRGYTCHCDTGFRGNAKLVCEDMDECAESLNECSENANCTNTVGSYTCACKKGLSGNGRTCKDINECTNGQSNCPSDSTCQNSVGSFRCVCNKGFRQKEENCSDINECLLDPCHNQASCNNIPGSYKCACYEGFEGDGYGECFDINECVLRIDNCVENADCINTIGNHRCECQTGYQGNGTKLCDEVPKPTSPPTEAPEVDECLLGIANCTSNSECADTKDGYLCHCIRGYTGDGKVKCNDIDECSLQRYSCQDNSQCMNTDGSYLCNCKDGYKLIENTCKDVNECEENTDNCSPQASCINLPGTLTCKCLPGFRGDGTSCEEVDECAAGDTCPSYSSCENTFGSFKCNCLAGFEMSVHGQECQDIDECGRETFECAENGYCINTRSSYTCSCEEGFTGIGSQECTDINECEEGAHDCGVNSVCINDEGGWTCECKSGYSGDPGYLCSDINECENADQVCSANSNCRNTPGGYTCTCLPGFEGDGKKECFDLDECTTSMHNCERYSKCINNPGSFSCACLDGFRLNDNEICTDVDECDENLHSCLPERATCKNTKGSFTCSCKDGYLGDGRSTCVAEDLCGTGNHNCPEDTMCKNTEDGFTCVCRIGYKMILGMCKDINECEDPNANICDSHAKCINNDGSFECRCLTGYTGDGASCEDIDECSEPTKPCHENAECRNSIASYTCTCLSGYTGDGEDDCRAYDLCGAGRHNCLDDQICKNVEEGFTCACHQGFELVDSKCEDINECDLPEDNKCDENSNCTNSDGSYYCHCITGYRGNGFRCEDIDECSEEPCHENADCTNNDGSYTCACKTGYSGEGYKECVPIPTTTAAPTTPPPPAKTSDFCYVKNSHHFVTFDNMSYSFIGSCSYVLAQSACDSAPPVSIELVKDNPQGGILPKLLKILVKINGLAIELRRGLRLVINGAKTNTPFTRAVAGLQILLIGDSLRLETSYGIFVSINSENNVRVGLPQSFLECSEGLCGNFDREPSNDLKDKEPPEFGEIWKSNSGDASCQPSIQYDSCQSPDYDSGECDCSILASEDGCFSGCDVPSQKYFQDCSLDSCLSKGSQNSLLSNIAAYAEACLAKKALICDWRKLCGLTPLCPANSQYTRCVKVCPQTCSRNDTTLVDCESKECIPGCECNNGFVKSGDRCVPKSECGCFYEETYYQTGESLITRECEQQCVCEDGEMVCTPTTCPDGTSCKVGKNGKLGCQPLSYGVCRAYGDPHYYTFDRTRQYHFMGKCVYRLSETKLPESDPNFYKIIVEHEERSNPRVSYTKSATVHFNNGSVQVRFEKRLLPKVNGISYRSYTSPGGKFTVRRQGRYYTLTTSFGLKFEQTRSNVRLTIPSTYKGKVFGLCGDFNGNPADDLRLPDGSITKSSNEFGMSHQVEDCAKADPPPEFVCSPSDNERYSANDVCGVLTKADGPFAECHFKVDVTDYFSSCVFDVCVYKGDRNVLEEALDAYSRECQRNGVGVCTWRASTGFVKFEDFVPSNSHFSGCASACPNTCTDPNAEDECEEPNIEDYVCNEGYMRDGEECVQISECGCQLPQGPYIEKGYIYMDSNNCVLLCECLGTNNLRCVNTTCAENEVCQLNKRGFHVCMPTNIKPTPPPKPATCDGKKDIDLVIALDTSSSIGNRNFNLIKMFLSNLIRRFEVGSDALQVAALTYSRTISNLWSLKEYQTTEGLLRAIRNMNYPGGGTRTGLALETIYTKKFRPDEGKRPNATTVTLVLTDGVSQDPVAEPANLLQSISRVIALGVKDASLNELKEIGSKPDEIFSIMVDDFNGLGSLFNTIINAVCYVNDDSCVSDPCINGGTCILSSNKDYECLCPGNFTGKNCEIPPQDDVDCRTKGKLDLVFLLDASGSVGAANFDSVKTFVAKIVDGFTIGPDSVQVAAARYTKTWTDLWQLNKYSSKINLLRAIHGIEYVRGGTLTGNALRKTAQYKFTAAAGRREAVKAVTVVVTDGRSYDSVQLPGVLLRNQSTVIAVGVRNAIRSQLHQIASYPPEIYSRELSSFTELDAVVGLLFNIICSVNDGPCSRQPCLNGGKCNDLGDGSYNCTCSDGYSGDSCESAGDIIGTCPSSHTWTPWFNEGNPRSRYRRGDVESLQALVSKSLACSHPSAIQAQTASGSSYRSTGDRVEIYVSRGLRCVNYQKGNRLCSDYKVRYCCPSSTTGVSTTSSDKGYIPTTQTCPTASHKWTEWFDQDTPSRDSPGDTEMLSTLTSSNKACSSPRMMQVVTVADNLSYKSTGDSVRLATSRGFRCTSYGRKLCQDYKVRYCCPLTSSTVSKPSAKGDVSLTTSSTTDAGGYVPSTGTCPSTSYKWTEWFDQDTPSRDSPGDTEMLSTLTSSNKACSSPRMMQVVTVADNLSYKSTGDSVRLATSRGFRCTSYGSKLCQDYKVRYCCPLTSSTVSKPTAKGDVSLTTSSTIGHTVPR